MTDVDRLVDKSLAKSELANAEPKHVLVLRWFRTWKMFKYETSNKECAYDKFNDVMSQLMQHDNIVIDRHKSRVIYKDLAPVCCSCTMDKFIVEIYWRNIKGYRQ